MMSPMGNGMEGSKGRLSRCGRVMSRPLEFIVTMPLVGTVVLEIICGT